MNGQEQHVDCDWEFEFIEDINNSIEPGYQTKSLTIQQVNSSQLTPWQNSTKLTYWTISTWKCWVKLRMDLNNIKLREINSLTKLVELHLTTICWINSAQSTSDSSANLEEWIQIVRLPRSDSGNFDLYHVHWPRKVIDLPKTSKTFTWTSKPKFQRSWAYWVDISFAI